MNPTKPIKDNQTPQAVDDLLGNLVVEPGGSYVIASIEDLLYNDRVTTNFYGLVGADEGGVVHVDGGTIEIIDGNIIFAANSDFTAGSIEFEYQIRMGNEGVLSTAKASFNTDLLLDFDGISIYESPIPSGYGGLQWSNQWTITPWDDLGGYTVLKDYEDDGVAFNGMSFPSSVQSLGNDFDFLTGTFCAAWNNGLNLEILAFDDGVQVGSLQLVINPTQVFVDFKQQSATGADSAIFEGTFDSIDAIRFYSSGGTYAGFSDSGEHFATDDWTIAYEQSVV